MIKIGKENIIPDFKFFCYSFCDLRRACLVAVNSPIKKSLGNLQRPNKVADPNVVSDYKQKKFFLKPISCFFLFCHRQNIGTQKQLVNCLFEKNKTNS